MMSLALIPAYAIHVADQTREFVFTAPEGTKSVSVAGTFNGWSASADPMVKQADGRTWKLRRDLTWGKHLYKFVINGETWIVDPLVKTTETDGGGHTNTVLIHLPADYAKPAQLGDGTIATSTISHKAGIPDLNYDRGHLTFRLRLRPNDAETVRIQIGNQDFPLTRISGDEITSLYEYKRPWNRTESLAYRFLIRDGGKTWSYGSKGLAANANADLLKVDAQNFQPFEVPKWVEQTVFYQIFPDRFANGDATNDPMDVRPWDSRPDYWSFHGGDLAGMSENLDYLSDLGITGIYFNPVFYGPSNHRYETTSYTTIDWRLGSNEEFKSLVGDLKKRGIRTVLDGVFNHTSIDFPAFQGVRRDGESSGFKNWYFVNQFPVRVNLPANEKPSYEAWFGFQSMPKLNVMNPDVTRFILGVTDFWDNEAQIDGWRLDVANEVPKPFWRTFRSHLKSKNTNTWIIGENWTNSSEWLQGDQWDSAMNYPFRTATLEYIAKGTASGDQFLDQLFTVYAWYPPQVSRNMLNLISSHDVPRFMHECGDDSSLAAMGAVALMSWVGTPCIYYGDELGMTGGADPMNRRGMEWERATDSNKLLGLYQRLIAARNSSEALQSGDPVRLNIQGTAQSSGFGRVLGNDLALALFNRADAPATLSVSLKGLPKVNAFHDVVNGTITAPQGDTLRITLPPKSAALLRPHADPTLITRNSEQSLVTLQ